MSVSVAENLFGCEDYHFAHGAEGVEVDVVEVGEDGVVVGASGHVVALVGLDVVEGEGGNLLEEHACGVVGESEVACVDVGPCDVVLDGALCAQAAVDALLGEVEGGLAAGHVVDDVVEGMDGVEHLVVLRGDEGHVGVGLADARGPGHGGGGGVGEGAALAHLLEYDGVHASAEVFVVEGAHGLDGGIERLAAVAVLAHVELLGVVGREEDGGLGCGAELVGFAGGRVGELGSGDVQAVDGGYDAVGGQLAVVDGAMAQAAERTHGVEHGLGTHGAERVDGEKVVGRVVLAVKDVVGEACEIGALVGLLVVAALLYAAEQGFPSLGSDGGFADELLVEDHGGRHVLAEAAEHDVAAARTHAEAVAACEVVECAAYLLGCHVRRAGEAEDVGGIVEGEVVAAALVVYVDEGEDVVGVVAGVEHFGALFGGYAGEVAVEVDEHRLDGLDGCALNLTEEGAGSVAVGGDGGELGFGHLHHCGVFALALVDGGVVVGAEVAAGGAHDVVLADGVEGVEVGHQVGEGLAVDECVDVHVGAAGVLFEGLLLVELVVGGDGLYEVGVKVAGAELVELGKQEGSHLVECLAGFGRAYEDERTAVGHADEAGAGSEHGLGEVDVYVDEAAVAVAEYFGGNLEELGVGVGGRRRAPCEVDALRLGTVDLTFDGCGDGLLGLELKHGQPGVGLEMAEIACDYVDHVVGVEVAAETDGHVVRDVPLLVVVLYVGDGGVLEIFLRAEHGLRAVGMVGEEGCEGCLVELAVVLGEAHVLLLVDGFELGVEAADYGVLEAVGLYAGPVLDLVGGDVLDVAGDVVACVGVGAVGADGRHELVVLVGYGQQRCLVAHRVDFVVDGLAGHAVGGVAVLLEELLDAVEHRLFCGVVGGAELFGALEHEVLEIVGEAGGLGGVVLAAYAHGDVCLYAGLVAVDSHEQLEAVREGVGLGVQGVARHRVVGVLVGACRERAQRHGGCSQHVLDD